MKEQGGWVYGLLKRLSNIGFIDESDIQLYEMFFNIKSFVELKDVDEVFVLLKDYKKPVSEIEMEMWRVKNEFFKRKNGKKLIVVCIFFEAQLEKKPYVNYNKERIAKIKLLSSFIAKLFEKNFKEY